VKIALVLLLILASETNYLDSFAANHFCFVAGSHSARWFAGFLIKFYHSLAIEPKSWKHFYCRCAAMILFLNFFCTVNCQS